MTSKNIFQDIFEKIIQMCLRVSRSLIWHCPILSYLLVWMVLRFRSQYHTYLWQLLIAAEALPSFLFQCRMLTPSLSVSDQSFNVVQCVS